MTKVALIFGGRSPEHEVSIVSARYVHKELLGAGYTVIPIGIGRDGSWHLGADAFSILEQGTPHTPASTTDIMPRLTQLDVDVAFPLIHGVGGEDGCIQGLCHIINLPYVGGDALNASLCWDKLATRTILLANHIPQLPYAAFYKHDFDEAQALHQVEAGFDFPVFVKPARTGSSIGISRVDDKEQLAQALQLAFKFDYRIIVEPGLVGAREIEIAGIGGLVPRLSVPAEILCENDYYDFEEKYIKNTTSFDVPAHLPPHQWEKLRFVARRSWQLLNCYGMARIDFLVSEDEVYLNEINTCPGFTSISMYPRLLRESGISGSDMMSQLITLALERDKHAPTGQVFESNADWWKG